MMWNGFGLLLVIGVVAFGVSAQTTYAQTIDSDQVSITDDIANNPLAQEILQKIEQTKKWIADLEQRNYENLQKQEELEQKRQQALDKLNQDLKEWEKLWEYYSPENSFARFVDKIPDPQVQEVFWDQFEFKEQKVEAGRDAFKKVIHDGGSRQDALQAYLAAAETKRIELIEANSQFNVRHNLAYYSQQVLFDKEGKFVDTLVTGKELRKHYEDYRTNPAYLDANPDDAISWNDLQHTSPDTECREGHIVVHRFHANDFVCVSIETAEMWIRHGMGEIVGQSSENNPHEELVNPLTRCDEGFTLVHNLKTDKHSCVFDDTASQWIEDEIAAIPDPEEFIKTSIEKKDAHRLIDSINDQIWQILDDFENKKIELKKEYDQKYDDVIEQSKIKEKEVAQDYNERSGMSKEELSIKISQIRETLEDEKEKILKDKIKETKNLEKQYGNELESLAEEYEFEPYMKIVKHSNLSYEAVFSD